MRYYARRLLLLAPILLIASMCLGQQAGGFMPLTADSLATGNYKDVLASFFQIAVNKFTSPDKELRFTSNPFAVMAKMNPALLVDTNYYKYRHLRDLNFSFAAKLDTAYRFNGFSSSVSYALINQRDYTVSRAFVVSAFNANGEFNRLTDSLGAYAAALPRPVRAQFVRQVNQMLSDSTFHFNQLDTSVQRIVKEYARSIHALRFLKLLQLDPALNVYKASQQTYDSLKQSFQNKLLWTAGIADTTYKDQFFFSNIVLSTQLLKGVVNPTASSNLELDLRAWLQLTDDTLQAGRNLKRSIFSFEPGLNWVLKAKGTQQSFLELKLSGSYYRGFGSLYTHEKRDSLTLNGTLRIRVFNDVWIPLEIKYDPRNGQVFGFLNVRVNFAGIKK